MLLGIDVGTSGCKAGLFTRDGNLVHIAHRVYPLQYPQPGWMELDPCSVWNAVTQCIIECCCDGRGMQITAVAISTQGEAVIPVGKEGRVLHPAVVTFDNRNIEQAKWMEQRFGKEKIMQMTGAPVHPMFTLPKIMWFQRERPDIFSQVWKFLCFGDYIAYLLGASPAIDYTMASRTLAFDIREKRWSSEILDLCSISEELLPKAVATGTVIGKVSNQASALTGLPSGTAIVAGAHDQICCALGAGVLEEGVAMDSLGTTESILCISRTMAVSQENIRSNLPCYVHALPDYYAYFTFLSCSGSVLNWYTDRILADGVTFGQMDEGCAGYDRPGEMLMLPYFTGSGTPFLDASAQGVLTGLTLGTTREQIYLAIMEGTALEARYNMEVMVRCGICPNEFRCIGGGARSELWMQIKSDVCGKPLAAMQVNEAGCLGAAAIAASAVPGCGKLDEILRAWVRVGRVYEPDMARHIRYNDVFMHYQRLYEFSKALEA